MAKQVPVGPASELREGDPRLVVHKGVPYCVIRSGGEVRAFVAACSHKDLPLVPLRLKKGKIPCPHHGATFDPATGELVDDRGKDVPCGMPRVELSETPDGALSLLARKRHRKLIKKKERRRLEREHEATG